MPVFAKSRERLIEGDIANKFMAAVLNQKAVRALLSNDHFSVDGTLLQVATGEEVLTKVADRYGLF